MLSRNALVFVAATALSAAGAAAQQPAKPATSTSHRSTTTQAPSAAKKTTKTSAAAPLAVNADSARKIVAANAAGATVTSTHLHRSGGKSYYTVSYKLKGAKSTMHANVDATTGAFSAAAPATPATPANPSSKKPS